MGTTALDNHVSILLSGNKFVTQTLCRDREAVTSYKIFNITYLSSNLPSSNILQQTHACQTLTGKRTSKHLHV